MRFALDVSIFRFEGFSAKPEIRFRCGAVFLQDRLRVRQNKYPHFLCGKYRRNSSIYSRSFSRSIAQTNVKIIPFKSLFATSSKIRRRNSPTRSIKLRRGEIEEIQNQFDRQMIVKKFQSRQFCKFKTDGHFPDRRRTEDDDEFHKINISLQKFFDFAF